MSSKEIAVKVSGRETRVVSVEPGDTPQDVLSELDLSGHFLGRPGSGEPWEFFGIVEDVYRQVKDGQQLMAMTSKEVKTERANERIKASPGVSSQRYLLKNMRVTLTEAARLSGMSAEGITGLTERGYLEDSGEGKEYLYTCGQVQKIAYITVFRYYGCTLKEASKRAEEEMAKREWGHHPEGKFTGPAPTWELLVEGIRYGLRDTFQEVITDPGFQNILFEEIMEYPAEDNSNSTSGGDLK